MMAWGLFPMRQDDAVHNITQLGRGAELAKLDLESAYRIILVHPDVRHLFGMEWQGAWYVDTALPIRPTFGAENSQCPS